MRLGFLAKILPPPENRFYDFFEEGAEVCQLAAYLFYQIVHSPIAEREPLLTHARAYKKRAAAAKRGCLALLDKSFITPIDREDIQMIAAKLYKATKIILKACANLRIYRIDDYSQLILEQSDLIAVSAEELRKLMTIFRNGAPMQEVSQLCDRIQEIESTGDDLLFSATEELFSGKYEALHVLKLRAIYKGIENALDNCSDISDLILTISLKHS